MTDFFPLWDKGPVFAQAEHFKLGTDSILLSDFVKPPASAKKGIDLGCASGIIPLLLLKRSERLHMTGLEINPDAAALAGENMAVNGLSQRSEMICGDIREHRTLFCAGSFDLVTANPPYFTPGSGYISPDSDRAAARGELQCTLEDICSASAYLLKTGGSLFLVHRCERLAELMSLMVRYRLEPKRLRLVQHRPDSAPILILVEGRRGGKPGLKIEETLILSETDGSETAEYKRIYHRI